MNGKQFQFEWDEIKAAANIQKHGISFKLASTVFRDPRLLTVADLEHSEDEERWISIGIASTGAILAVAYIWSQSDIETITARIITARNATKAEIRQYEEDL